jgi:GNAT superfamily N-acetyltransferase
MSHGTGFWRIRTLHNSLDAERRANKAGGMEWRLREYVLTDDPERADLAAICTLLSGTYWAKGRTPAVIDRSVRGSLCFSLFHEGRQIGLTRVVTDLATVGYVCDVVIAEEHRGQGIGRWMMATIIAHPELRGCRLDLFTGDAQEFYRSFGFGPPRYTSMVRYPDDYAGGSGSEKM